MEIVNEQKIIEQVLNGDTQAFEAIVLSYQDMVFTLALRILKVVKKPKKLLRMCLLKYYSSLSGFNRKSKLSTWIYRICYNTSINKLRSVKKHDNNVDLEAVTEPESGPDILHELTSREESGIIKESILKLSENERVIITLYYYEELSVAEIAEITGLSVQNIKVKLYRSRQKLYKELTNKVDQKILDYEYS